MSSLPPPPPPPVDPRTEPNPDQCTDPYTELLRSVAADRVDDAADARRRTHWLLRQSEEEGSFAGVLADLAERADAVVCTTRHGRRHVGRLHALGADFVAVRNGGGLVLVALDALAQVRTHPGTAPVTGDRAVRLERRMVEVLAELCSERPDVVVGTGEAEVRGELRAVGRDVVTLRMSGRPATAAYVALAATDEVRVG
jgi:hypothetical protein